MKESMLTFIVSYILLFIIYFIFVYLKGRKNNNILNSVQVEFLLIRFGFKKKELNTKKIALLICFIDSLIISLTGTIVTSIKMHFMLQIIIGFVLLMAFIFSFYEITGRILKNKMLRNKRSKKRKDDKNV